jgi:dihydrofolate reductase
MVTLVVAVAKNRAIGLNNQLPWHLPEDLQHFKKTTLGHTLIMGRKTFDSIGKPLPGRRIIVLTKNKAWQHEGCETASDLTQALNLAKSTPERQAFIVGGAAVYEQALKEQIATQIIMTEIDLEPKADAYFPVLSTAQWHEQQRQTQTSKTGLQYAILHLVRT